MLDAPALQQLFALTAAEAAVALALAAGGVREKTGAQHLCDLIRLLAGLPAQRSPRTTP